MIEAGAGSVDTHFGDNGVVFTPFNSEARNDFVGVVLQSDGKFLAAEAIHQVAGEDSRVVRYNPDGSEDATFASRLLDHFMASAIALQNDGAVLVAGTRVDGDPTAMEIIRLISNGEIDTTFGSAGKVVADFGGAATGNAMALQVDGKIVVIGSVTNTHLGLIRLNTDGSFDATFDSDGTALMSSFTMPNARAIVIQPDGKILAGGSASSSTVDFLVVRVNSDGTLDSTFGNAGLLDLDFDSLNNFLYALALDSQGKILMAGWSGSVCNSFAVARANSDGTMDASFDGDGKVVVAVGCGNDTAYSILAQSDGRILALGGGWGKFDAVSLMPDGVLDSTFNGSGILSTTIGGFAGQFMSACRLPDSRILAAGAILHPVDSDGMVTVFDSAGVIDTSFGENGLVMRGDPGPGTDLLTDVHYLNDNKILSVGAGYGTSGLASIVLARYGLDGSLDPVFGNGGKTETHLGLNMTVGRAALQSDGKVVVTGGGAPPNSGALNVALLRYNSDGSPDVSFGTNGVVLADSGANLPDRAYDIAIQPDGKIVIAGYRDNDDDNDFLIMRFLPDGSIDPTFGSTSPGVSTIDLSSGDQFERVLLLPDGKIVAGGSTRFATQDFVVFQFNSDGTLDTGFGSNGMATADFGDSDYLHSLAVQPDGKIVAAGESNGSVSSLALARFNPDGSLDASFNSNGMVLTQPPACVASSIRDVTLQNDGRILAAGYYLGPGNYEFAAARYHADGTLDTSFGAGGFVFSDLNNGNDQAAATLIQPNGKILLGGYSSSIATEGWDFALQRLFGSDFLLQDEFEDGIADWTVLAGAWIEANGSLTSTAKKNRVVAPVPWSPSGVSFCSVCTIEVDFSVSALNGKTIIHGWYQDPNNDVSLTVKKDGRWKLLQKSAGKVVAKSKAKLGIVAGQNYHVEINFDGGSFRVFVDGINLMTVPAGASAQGNAGLEATGSPRSFNEIIVY